MIRYFEHVFPVALGTEGDDVAEVLARQHYQLASWRDTDTMLNYRRFFEVDQLIAVRVELPDVFEATHRVLLGLNHDGVIDGFRIDHPDGLADPEGYLTQLREATRPGTLIWVEKILEGSERLPTSWACDGTTGYDAMQAIQAALVDPATAPALDRAWAQAGGQPDVERSVDASKRQVVDQSLGPEVERLTRRAREALPEQDPERLREASSSSSSPVRSTAPTSTPTSGCHRWRASGSRTRRRRRRGPARPRARARAADAPGHRRGRADPAAVDFAIRLQQTWGPVMAKGIEDTTFYRWHRLVALNEVGGDPAVLDSATPSRLHEWAAAQQRDWPRGMTTLSTHDTKRSEDVRARLLAVAGDGRELGALLAAFARGRRRRRRPAHRAPAVADAGRGRLHPPRAAARLPRQGGPRGQAAHGLDRRRRGLRGAGAGPGRPRRWPPATCTTSSPTRSRPTPSGIRATVLAAKLAAAVPARVPDTYQGCEVVDLSLVDPDNRRAVDYAVRVARLARLDDGAGAVRPRRREAAHHLAGAAAAPPHPGGVR